MGESTCRWRTRRSGRDRPQGVDDLLSRDHQLGSFSIRRLRPTRGIAMPTESLERSVTRRGLFRSMSGGICGAALTYLLGRDASRLSAAEQPRQPPIDLKPRPPHFAAKARSVIHLFMNGGPSQMDLSDPKP